MKQRSLIFLGYDPRFKPTQTVDFNNLTLLVNDVTDLNNEVDGLLRQIANINPSGVTFAGDLSGSSTTQTVIGLQTVPINAGAPTLNDVLTFDGAQWIGAPATSGTPSLTQNQVAFGDAANLMTSSADLTFDDATNTLTGAGNIIAGAVGGFYGGAAGSGVGGIGFNSTPDGGYLAGVNGYGALMQLSPSTGTFSMFLESNVLAGVGHAHTTTLEWTNTGKVRVPVGLLLGTLNTTLGNAGFYGSTSGLVTIQTKAIAGTWTLTLPDTDGNANEFLQTDGSGITSWAAGNSGTVTSVGTSTGLTGGTITTTGTISLNTKLAPADSLTGNALKVLRVNAGETAVEYATPTAGTVTSVSGTTNRITSTGGATPVIDISSNYDALWQPIDSDLTALAAITVARGAIITGSAAPAWQRLALGGNGTILRSDGSDIKYSTATFSDTYTASNLLYSNGANTVTGLATANSSVLVTDGSGVPSISQTLPNGILATTQAVGTSNTTVATTAFVRTSNKYVFAYSHSTANSTNTTGEEVIASVLIPSGTLGNNDEIEVVAEWQAAGTGGTKIYKVRLHTSAAAAGTLYATSGTLANTTLSYRTYCRIVEKNANNSQEGAIGGNGVASGQAGGFGNNINNAFATSSLSTGADMYIVFTSQKATGTDTASLNNYIVWITKNT